MFVKIRPFGLLFLGLTLLSCYGCWDQSEIKERSMVIGFGIDQVPGPEPLELTIQLVSSRALQSKGQSDSGAASGKSGLQNDSVIIKTSRGKTFAAAIRNFNQTSPRQISFFHNQVIVFGKNLAQSGVSAVLDTIVRDPQFRSTNWIFTAPIQAQEVMKAQTGIGSYPAKDLSQMMNKLTKAAFVLPVNRNDFIIQMKSEGRAAVAPLLELEPAPQQDAPPRFKIDKMALFHNYRLVNYLTPAQTQALLWFGNGSKATEVIFPFRTGKGSKPVSIEILSGDTFAETRIDRGRIFLSFTCTGRGILQESEDLQNNPRTIARLENQVEQRLKKQAEELIHYAQTMKIDFLGFGRTIHSFHPEEWRRTGENWDSYFPRVQTRVKFRINLIKFGITRDSLNINE